MYRVSFKIPHYCTNLIISCLACWNTSGKGNDTCGMGARSLPSSKVCLAANDSASNTCLSSISFWIGVFQAQLER